MSADMTLVDDHVRVFMALTTEPWATTPTWTNISTLAAATGADRGVRGVDIYRKREGGAGGKFRPGRATIALNNYSADWDTANSSSVFGSNLKRNKLIQVRTHPSGFVSASANLFTGYITDVIPRGNKYGGSATMIVQDILGLFSEYDIDDLVRPAEATGVRVAAILSEIGVPASVQGTIQNGTVIMPAATLSGDGLSLLYECARAEYGYLFCDADGDINFYERYAPLTVTQWNTRAHSFTADGNGSTSAIRNEDVIRSLGLRKVTRVTATRSGGGPTQAYDTTTANNPPTTPTSGAFGLAVAYDADVEVAAEAWHAGWDYDGERLETLPVMVHPGNANALTAVHAGYYEPMTRVEAQLQPVGFSSDFNFEGRIEAIEHHIGLDTWTAKVTLSPYFTEWEGRSAHFYPYSATLVSTHRAGI